MRAAGVMVYGGPEALEVVDLPEVHAGPGQVRVRVHAAAVNPTDTMARNGSRAEQQKVDPPPYVPGMDAAGIVDEVGPGVTMAVTGAAGAYGGYVVQLAKAEGLTVIADASEADHALVKALGADIVVRRGDDVATRILEHFPHGVDGLADGAVLTEKVIPAVRDGGAFTSVRGFIGAPQRGIRFTATSVRTYDGEFEKLDRLRQLVESGAVTLRVAATYPPERAADAHRRLEAGGTRGRLVITFGPRGASMNGVVPPTAPPA